MNNRFSSIPIDQLKEYTVCWLKNESGVIGNLDDPQTVRRHQAAIPELARIVQEFESDVDDEKYLYHEMMKCILNSNKTLEKTYLHW